MDGKLMQAGNQERGIEEALATELRWRYVRRTVCSDYVIVFSSPKCFIGVHEYAAIGIDYKRNYLSSMGYISTQPYPARTRLCLLIGNLGILKPHMFKY